jgi:hypothetical protein
LLLTISALLMSSAQSAELLWDGHYRARTLVFDSLSLSDENPQAEGLSATMDHRAMLAPTWAITANIALHAQLDVLAGNPWGGVSDTWTDPVTGDAIPLANADGVLVDSNAPNLQATRFFGDIYTPYGRLRFGRMPVEWGAGILLNPGTSVDSEFGDTSDRVQFTTKLGGVYLVGAWDLLSEGFSGVGDDMHIANFAVAYRTESLGFGLLNRYRFQSDPDFASYTGDLWAKATLGSLFVQGEFVVVLGGGDLDTGADNVDISAFGGLLQLGMSVQDLQLGVEMGWASGDEDPDGDSEYHTFTFDRDHNVGLMIFEEPMPVLESTVLNSTNAGRDYDALRTGEGVSNAQYLRPNVGWKLRPNLEANLAAIFARAAKLPTGTAEENRGLGTEIDLSATWAPYENFWLEATAAVFLPGPWFSSYSHPDLGGDFDAPALGGRLFTTVEF